MSNNRHRSRWYSPLKYLFLPALVLAFEIWRWNKMSVITRSIVGAVFVCTGALMLIWWQVDQTNRRKRISHHRRRHRRREDYR